MTHDEFEVLAAKVLSGEATEEERARLQEAVRQDSELQAEFGELRTTWTAVKEVGALAEALNAAPAAPPPEQLRKLQAGVAKKFADKRDAVIIPLERERKRSARFAWALAAACLALAAIIGVFLVSRPANVGVSSAPVAYLVTGSGTTEVRRDGKTLPGISGSALRGSDEIRLLSGASATVITSNGIFSLQGPRTIVAGNVATSPPTNVVAGDVSAALFGPSERMLALLVTTRNSHSIPIYSPAGFTASLTPPILWKSEPGKTYDILITDELNPRTAPLRRGGVVSPLQFTNAWPERALAKDGLYRLRVTETGKPLTATEITFRTLPQQDVTSPSDPAQQLSAAYHVLTANPSRLGDALAILLTLPPEIADSELALRLKLFAFGQLGYREDFEVTRARIESRK